MSRILVFAGTTEGRELAKILEYNKCKCDVCVATEYGSQLIKSSEYITVHEGRLDAEAMVSLYKETGCEIVVDATHPFARVVTETIKKSLENTELEYIRLLRANGNDLSECGAVYADTSECVQGLLKTTGKILLTTGSKELKAFTDGGLLERLVVRVLPGMESLKLCYDAGLEGKQIIAMQGPFSLAMNEATLRQYRIEHLVTKESGANGGVDEKIQAAINSDVKIHVIARPDEEGSKNGNSTDLMKVVEILKEKLSINLDRKKLDVALIGIGCGSDGLLTREAKNYIDNADILFGAQRMIDSVESAAKKYPYYLKKDIFPKLEEIYGDAKAEKVAVLFSGDTGFFSGAAKLYEALKQDERFNAFLMPGVSSVSYFAAKLGIDWGTASVLSLHGKKVEEWLPLLVESVNKNTNTFFITSGVADLKIIGESYKDCPGIKIYAGYNLSYEDECIRCLTASECMTLNEEGLYTLAIVNEQPEKQVIVPCIKDDEFIRDSVPMTKEAVRELSLCKLKLRDGDVFYDIGSGTGSIAIQAAALSSAVKVYALECNDEAINLIYRNIEKFGVKNVKVIKAMAPDGLNDLPKADCAFIGGSKGKLKEILDALVLINPSMRIVINAVSMESITEVFSLLSSYSYKNLDITQASISTAKKLGEYNLLQAGNPVFVFSFDFC